MNARYTSSSLALEEGVGVRDRVRVNILYNARAILGGGSGSYDRLRVNILLTMLRVLVQAIEGCMRRFRVDDEAQSANDHMDS